jgi:hypothetical protein
MPYKDHNKKLQRDREYRQENLARLNEYDKSRYLSRHRRSWINTHYAGLQGGYTLLRRMAVRRKCDLAISFDEYRMLIEGKSCWYCNADLTKRRGHKLDRADNRLGYSVQNVVPCCFECNRAKGILERWGYRPPEILRLTRLVREGKYCVKGHALTKDTIFITKSGYGNCRICMRLSGRDSMRRRRAAKKRVDTSGNGHKPVDPRPKD